jgi:hypothetical protein
MVCALLEQGGLTFRPDIKLNLRVWLHNIADKLSLIGLGKLSN